MFMKVCLLDMKCILKGINKVEKNFFIGFKVLKIIWRSTHSVKKLPAYSKTSMAWTPLEPWKYVRNRGSSSLRVLIIAPVQET